ncbi:MAG: glycosyltransferase, partial [Eubacteriaceae bacterium]|nr:glycosyltransferase [Eubacteriaceae bacterium]
MKNQPEVQVSIIIPNFNGEAYIANCLQSLYRQKEQDFEIIVVDDASKDKSLAIIRHYPDVRLLINSKNLGFAASVNRGIRAS